MTELEEHLEIDRQKIENAVRLNLPIEMTTYTLPRNMEVYFRSIEGVFLEVCHQEHLKEYLDFCLGELLTNSKKANTKRVYFEEKNLDINDPADYAVGMEYFKDETTSNIEHYLELQKKKGYYIKFSLQLKKNDLVIQIRNNALLTSFEYERIQHKFALAQKYDNMDEVIANVLDQSEGAGLGIIIITLMLQKVGYTKENFKIFCTDTETITQIVLPCDRTISSGKEIISYEFVNLQSKLPVLKTNFEQVNKIIQTGTSGYIDRSALLECLRKDITLSLLLLKYALEKDKKCFSLPKALEILSDQELKFIFSDSNPTSDVISSTETLDKIWNHACKSAYFAYNLYKNKNVKGMLVDEEGMFLLGLLNSTGAILLNNASDEQKKYVVDLSNQYEGISEKLQDVFYLGTANHILTLIYTKKFGIPENITQFFNDWVFLEGTPESRQVLDLLYLAEMMEYYNEGIIEFYQIDKNISKDNEIESEEQLKSTISKMNFNVA